MAKIAVELEQAVKRRAETGAPGLPATRVLAQGDGWKVADLLCTSGPQDRPFQENHSYSSIAVVAAGSFRYHAATGHELMTPGSLLLGNPDQSFECGHEHGAGDRCLWFGYQPEYFERVAADAGARSTELRFRVAQLPPLRALSPVVARACAGLAGSAPVPWEELSLELAAQAVQLAAGLGPDAGSAPPGALARVTRTVRTIERHADARLPLAGLARQAGLSPFHFLRIFERLTGLTPHQYIVRARLREAALRLASERAQVLEIALDCGFGDVSNFNRAFRAEFGVNPRLYRQHNGGGARRAGHERFQEPAHVPGP